MHMLVLYVVRMFVAVSGESDVCSYFTVMSVFVSDCDSYHTHHETDELLSKIVALISVGKKSLIILFYVCGNFNFLLTVFILQFPAHSVLHHTLHKCVLFPLFR